MSEQAAFTLDRIRGTDVVRLTGEIDMSNGPKLEAVLEGARAGTGPAVIDLSGVRYCDSRTLYALATFETDLRRAGRPVSLAMPSGAPAHRIFQAAGLMSRFERFDTLEAALGT